VTNLRSFDFAQGYGLARKSSYGHVSYAKWQAGRHSTLGLIDRLFCDEVETIEQNAR